MMMATEYVFRGISQSNEDPAIQVGIDYMYEPSGFYVGTWASSVEFNTGLMMGRKSRQTCMAGSRVRSQMASNGIWWSILLLS